MEKKETKTPTSAEPKKRNVKPLSVGAARLKAQFAEQKQVDKLLPEITKLTRYGLSQILECAEYKMDEIDKAADAALASGNPTA